jgi:FMN-dependent NADH-azoreductase
MDSEYIRNKAIWIYFRRENGYYLKSNMDSDTFYTSEIYHKFKYEWTTHTWSEFIESKDLGIEYLDHLDQNLYKIVDEKKWLLAKIKYGF